MPCPLAYLPAGRVVRVNDVIEDQAARSDSSRRRVSIPVMAAFGSGELGPTVVTIGLYSLLLFYYQQIGTSALIVSTARTRQPIRRYALAVADRGP